MKINRKLLRRPHGIAFSSHAISEVRRAQMPVPRPLTGWRMSTLVDLAQPPPAGEWVFVTYNVKF